ncbi:MAG TPA: TonB-dependent receptor [Polyangiaceae bacterium]|nr:TonB-dependent receptor [Polyangiaceae bacterium]
MRFLSLFFLCLAAPCLARAEPPQTITVQGEARPPGEIGSEPFVAASRVQGERLAAPGLRAPEVLRGEAGVQITEAGGFGAPATASIRGATAAQTPVYLGGVRLNDQVGGVADLSTIPLWLVDRVDVYRGNAPFDVDELGIGGAIAFEPRRPKKSEAAAGATLGSFGTRGGFGYFSLAKSGNGVLAGISAERADNDYRFNDDRGTLFRSADDSRRARANADSHLYDAWLVAKARPSERTRLELLLNDVSREQGVPKLALVPSRSARAELSRTLAALTARLQLGESGTTLLTLGTSMLDGTSTIHDPERELGTSSDETRVQGRRVEQRAALLVPLGGGVTWAASSSADVESQQRRDGAVESSAKASTLRAATRAEWTVGRITLFGLVSGQCRRTTPGEAGCAELEPTGRVGAGYRARAFTAFANLSRYQRVPTLGELYGAGVLVRGNAALRPELGISADAGVRGGLKRGALELRGESSAFVRQASDLVTYARAAQGYVVPVNVGRARVAGLEVGFGVRALGHVDLACNVSLLDPRDVTEGRRLQNDVLPFMSRLVLAPRLSLTTGELAGKILKRADLSADFVYSSNRFADAAGLIVVPEQSVLGLTAAAAWLSGVLLTKLRLANVLDAPRFDVVGYPLPGRSVYASLEVRSP